MLPLRREGRKREGASTVSLNHPLAAILTEARRNNAHTAVSIHDAVRLVHGDSGFCPDFGGAAGGTSHGLVALAAGLGMGIAAGLCGLGQGRATASATEALARNPGARAGILLLLTLGLAFMESLSLFTLVIIFVKVNY